MFRSVPDITGDPKERNLMLLTAWPPRNLGLQRELSGLASFLSVYDGTSDKPRVEASHISPVVRRERARERL